METSLLHHGEDERWDAVKKRHQNRKDRSLEGSAEPLHLAEHAADGAMPESITI